MTKEKDTALTAQEELKAKIQNKSGEGLMPTYDFIPVITIDNSSEEKEIDGEMTDVRCKARFTMQTGMEDGDSQLIEGPFSGVMVKIKYFVTKKYEPKPSIPFFYSQEFSSGTFTNGAEFAIKHKVEGGDDTIENINYPDFKEKYADMYKLNAVVYLLTDVGTEDSVERLVKVRIKGAAMSQLWDYLKTFRGKDDSMSFHNTVFTPVRKKEPQPYNSLTLSVDDKKNVDLELVSTVQDSIDAETEKKENKLLEATGKEVLNDNGDIVVEAIPFD